MPYHHTNLFTFMSPSHNQTNANRKQIFVNSSIMMSSFLMTFFSRTTELSTTTAEMVKDVQDQFFPVTDIKFVKYP